MWQIISAVSSVVTCLTFLLFLAGRILVLFKNRLTLYEKISVIPFDSNIDIEDEDNILIVDDVGHEFTLESDYGINKIEVYKVDYCFEDDDKMSLKSKSLKATYTKLNKDKLYVRCDLGEVIPTTQIKVKRADYAVITFDLCESGKNGHILVNNYKVKNTFKSILYYLCA